MFTCLVSSGTRLLSVPLGSVKRQSQVTINHAHLSGVQRNVIQVLAIIRLLPLSVLGALLVHAVQSSHT